MKKRTVTTLCALLLALALALAVYFAAAKAKAGTVELRNTGSALEWKYSGEGDESWRELTTTAALVGADG